MDKKYIFGDYFGGIESLEYLSIALMLALFQQRVLTAAMSPAAQAM